MHPSTFQAAVVRAPAGPASIEFVEVPVVDPGPGQVRLLVAAAPVNPVDLGDVSGRFHAMGLINQPDWTGLGWEFAGTVAAAGVGVDISVGTRVAGLVPGFDRDFGTYAEQLILPATDVAVVPDDLDLAAASTLPLNGLAALQILDLLGEPIRAGSRLLVTGAAGAVGGYLCALAPDRGWEVTGLARADDEPFVRGLGVDFIPRTSGGWDAVADAAAMQSSALALVGDGGTFVGVQPSDRPDPERGIRVEVVMTHPDAAALGTLLARAASGELPTRVHSTLPLAQVADAHRALAGGGIRGRYVLQPKPWVA